MYSDAEKYLISQELMNCNTICEQDSITLKEANILKKNKMFVEQDWDPTFKMVATTDVPINEGGDFTSVLNGYFNISNL